MSDTDDNLDELRAALRADAAGVAEALLGAPNKSLSTKHTFRWGNKGSFKLELRGSKRGVWHSKETDEGGDLLALIRQQHGCGFADAVAWARNRTGLAAAQPDNEVDRAKRAQQDADRRARQAEEAARDAVDEAAQRQRRIRLAQRIAVEAVPIAETAAEYYLKQNRGVPRPADGWPDCVRFHARNCSMVLIATTANGTVQAVQQVYLDQDGAKIGDEEMQRRKLPAIKVTTGVLDDAAVRLPGNPAGPLLLAEGPETALAAFTSSGYETWVALGNVGKQTPPVGRRIVVCRDDDKRHSPGDMKHTATISAWRRAGLAVTVATPWRVRRQDKSDLADTILAEGVAGVRKRIQAALAQAGTAVHRVSKGEARKEVATAVGAFFKRVDTISADKIAWDQQAAAAMQMNQLSDQEMPAPAPVAPRLGSFADEADTWAEVLDLPVAERPSTVFTHGVRVSVGVGKSHVARGEIARTLVAMHGRGDNRNMVLAVPMHALGDEQAAEFLALSLARKHGLRVAVWRGRAAPDPNHSNYSDQAVAREHKIKMCKDYERVADVQSIGLKAQTAACKRRITRPDGSNEYVFCPLFHGCAYQNQNKLEADLWITSHDLVFHEKPAAMGDIAAVIADEAMWRKGLIGAEGDHLALSLDALKGENDASVRLMDLRRQLSDLMDKLPNGPVRADALKPVTVTHDNGYEELKTPTLLTADAAAEAVKLEWAGMVDRLHPGMTRQERKEAMEQATGNRLIRRRVMAWNALRIMLSPNAPEASGWLSLATAPSKDGPIRVLRIKGRSEIKDGWKAPTLLLDALLPIDLVRTFWPDAELVADVAAAMPHQRIRQVTDRAYSKAMLEPLDEERADADPKEAQRVANRLRDLRAILIREARRYAPGKVLVVLQQTVEKALHDLGQLPPNVETAHHNNIAGRDQWKDVAAIIVVGRTLPSSGAIERITEALTGCAVAKPMEWYDRTETTREMADGSSLPAEADCHPDPIAEAIRWQIAEGELVQIIGRGRGVNRTEANPLDVLVLTDVPLPMPLAGTLGAADLQPDPSDLMMAAGGVVLTNARHVSAAYPLLWTTHNAADLAMRRSPSFPYKELYIGERRTPPVLTYQVKGAGQKAAGGWYDPALCHDPEAFLTEALGPLAWCKVEESPSPDPDPPPAPRPPPAADDEPPHGHPAWDRPPVDEPDGWVPLEHDQVEPADTAWPMPVQVPFAACDVPALHPEVAAYLEPGGGIALLCPYCGRQHRHSGFGHRLAHCVDPGGRGYVLRHAGPAPPSMLGEALSMGP